jgi:hypothetical protein
VTSRIPSLPVRNHKEQKMHKPKDGASRGLSSPDKGKAEVRKWTPDRPFTEAELEDALTSIDPETAEVLWDYADLDDPYGLGKQRCDYVGRVYFARDPANGIWVWFGELPDELREALLMWHEHSLAFPAGLELEPEENKVVEDAIKRWFDEERSSDWMSPPSIRRLQSIVMEAVRGRLAATDRLAIETQEPLPRSTSPAMEAGQEHDREDNPRSKPR